ncbi:endonuclease 8-like 3 isoform X2 [Ostrea edulis]|uniref:endonuclease 8-like 3 isoform X2 n=1 Tax=Ostrea edulis TaxID=37623 RepID=UPI0024AEB8C1|nr:endonuclease 8-like 3 isoform X2 [Ostrea edulis]
MVEGPGCKIKGEKIKSKLLNQTVKTVSGNAVNREKKPKKGITSSQFDVVVGRSLTSVQSLGKELFMYFGDVCLRIHFLMAGSFRVNGQALDKDYGKLTETPSLKVEFSKDVLTFYKSAVQIRESGSCSMRYADLHELDICSPVFNHQRAVAMVMEQSNRQVCDVLLDQTILPGVGNIIKNEALFDSGIKPSSKVQELSKDLVSHLVKMTRDFSLIFYKCRKTGSNLNQYMKIYNKRKCGQCEGKVTITRTGEDSERVTYYCPDCQTNTLKSTIKVHPCKNSLLGWVQSGRQNAVGKHPIEETEWACPICTLINKGTHLRCQACLTDREETHSAETGLKRQSTDSSEQISKRLKGSEDVCGIISVTNNKICDTGQSPAVNLDAKSTGKTASPWFKQGTFQKTISLNEMNKPQEPRNVNKIITRTKYNNVKDCKASVPRGMTSQSEGVVATVTSKIPRCPVHCKPCTMKQTRKKGDNYLRWFFTCGVSPRTNQCKFFKWADESFPICPNHGKPAAFRTVMKEGPNNGRKFFACPLPKQKQCGFFEWAEGF